MERTFFVCGDAPNVLVRRAKEVKRKDKMGWNMLGYIIIFCGREKNRL